MTAPNDRAGAAVSPPLACLLLSLTMLFWAGNVVFGRGLHAEVPPFAISFWRWTLAALLLLPFVWRELVARRAVIGREWPVLMAEGLFLVVGGNMLLYLAVNYTTALNASLINAGQPLVTAALAALVLRERTGPAQALGIAIGLGGVVAIVTRGDAGVVLDFEANPGDLWMLVAIVNWSIYAIILRLRPSALSAPAHLFFVMGFGGLLTAPFFAWEAAFVRSFVIAPHTLLFLLYTAVFASIVAVMFWNIGIATLGANRSVIFTNLLPVFVALIGLPILGERLQPFHLAGFALIFAGIVLMVRRPGRTGGPARPGL